MSGRALLILAAAAGNSFGFVSIQTLRERTKSADVNILGPDSTSFDISIGLDEASCPRAGGPRPQDYPTLGSLLPKGDPVL